MDRYQIHYLYSSENDINDIVQKVLKKELKKYLEKICKAEKSKLVVFPDSFLEGGRN